MWDQYCHLVVWLPIEAGYCKTKESGNIFVVAQQLNVGQARQRRLVLGG